MAVGYSEDLVGEALQVLYEKHGYKRERSIRSDKVSPKLCGFR